MKQMVSFVLNGIPVEVAVESPKPPCWRCSGTRSA